LDSNDDNERIFGSEIGHFEAKLEIL
jgi:hypothetical protein